jgi:hypothetical protein
LNSIRLFTRIVCAAKANFWLCALMLLIAGGLSIHATVALAQGSTGKRI